MSSSKCIPNSRRRSSSSHYSPRNSRSQTPSSSIQNNNANANSLSRKSRSQSVERIQTQSPHLVLTEDTSGLDSDKKNGSFLKPVDLPGHWYIVNRNLTALQTHFNKEAGNFISIRYLREICISHCEKAAYTNFMILEDPDIHPILVEVLPKIVDMALDLPKLFAGPIPILKRGDNATISVSRKLCASLLANAFMCTIPEEDRLTIRGGETFPTINFHDLFDTQLSWLFGRYHTKKEKVKCLLSYFTTRFGDQDDDLEMIQFQRRSIRREFDWKNCDKKLCQVKVSSTEPIENAMCRLQVDFANTFLGGGVIGNGCVQEEIRFATAPEMILSRLFMESMGDDEAVVIHAAKKYAEFSGYSTSFKFEGPVSKSDQWSKDTVVAIDATRFRWWNSYMQYWKSYIDRELHKAYVGFYPSKSGDSMAVATGNWGCGVFNGDRELKFLIQWMAVSASDRDGMQYHTFRDEKQSEEIEKVSDFLLDKEFTVGSLYGAVQECSQKWTGSVFEHLLELGGDTGGTTTESSVM